MRPRVSGIGQDATDMNVGHAPRTASPAAGTDGGLRVLPGFHGVAARFFQLASLHAPAGGFTPFTRDEHPDLIDEALWVKARRDAAEVQPRCGRGAAET